MDFRCNKHKRCRMAKNRFVGSEEEAAATIAANAHLINPKFTKEQVHESLIQSAIEIGADSEPDANGNLTPETKAKIDGLVQLSREPELSRVTDELNAESVE